jgi:hypothetical protein
MEAEPFVAADRINVFAKSEPSDDLVIPSKRRLFSRCPNLLLPRWGGGDFAGPSHSVARLANKILTCGSVETERGEIESSQTARPVTSLIITTITAITSIMWINPPATWNENPRSQRMNKITAIVQSINSSISMFTMQSRALVSPDV